MYNFVYNIIYIYMISSYIIFCCCFNRSVSFWHPTPHLRTLFTSWEYWGAICRSGGVAIEELADGHGFLRKNRWMSSYVIIRAFSIRYSIQSTACITVQKHVYDDGNSCKISTECLFPHKLSIIRIIVPFWSTFWSTFYSTVARS